MPGVNTELVYTPYVQGIVENALPGNIYITQLTLF